MWQTYVYRLMTPLNSLFCDIIYSMYVCMYVCAYIWTRISAHNQNLLNSHLLQLYGLDISQQQQNSHNEDTNTLILTPHNPRRDGLQPVNEKW